MGGGRAAAAAERSEDKVLKGKSKFNFLSAFSFKCFGLHSANSNQIKKKRG